MRCTHGQECARQRESSNQPSPSPKRLPLSGGPPHNSRAYLSLHGHTLIAVRVSLRPGQIAKVKVTRVCRSWNAARSRRSTAKKWLFIILRLHCLWQAPFDQVYCMLLLAVCVPRAGQFLPVISHTGYLHLSRWYSASGTPRAYVSATRVLLALLCVVFRGSLDLMCGQRVAQCHAHTLNILWNEFIDPQD